MLLTKIEIKNFRLLLDVSLEVDEKTTLIIGRNNTAKTSSMVFISKVLKNENLSYDDYPLSLRADILNNFQKLYKGKTTFDEFINNFSIPSVRFYIDYSHESDEKFLGALSPFIIDVDVKSTTAIIQAEYKIKIDETYIQSLFEKNEVTNKKGYKKLDIETLKEDIYDNFSNFLELVIIAIDPTNSQNTQIGKHKNLVDLFPFYSISAERNLDESSERGSNTLRTLITSYFSSTNASANVEINKKVENLKNIIENVNKKIQKDTSSQLSVLVDKSVGFGYPNSDGLTLGVQTKLNLFNHIQNCSVLTYSYPYSTEKLPSSHNGLGYKNLIKIQFELASFAEAIKDCSFACVPLLFIEEPESHMHPQMQQAFIKYLETFLGRLIDMNIQTFITTHSAHIANTVDFSKIRYAQKCAGEVKYKNLATFVEQEKENTNFIKKYLTLTKCDLFFADKAIFVEGASERLLIADMIEKWDQNKIFGLKGCVVLPHQYYTIIEVGGAYAHKFISLMRFLDIPSLIITDIDSTKKKPTIDKNGKTKLQRHKNIVSQGTHSSNETLNYWVRSVKNITGKGEVLLQDIVNLSDNEKTNDKVHIEFQLEENGLCGRSLEEAIKNVNRKFYKLRQDITEKDLKFDKKSKTDFALDLITKRPDYEIPQYIKNGLVWLNEQIVLN